MKAILVQVSSYRWTMQAIHFACALARNHQSEVQLLRLIPVMQPSYLGADVGYSSPSVREQHLLQECCATAEDYQVKLTLHNMQYVTECEAICDAADALDAGVVFAHIPESIIPYWHRFRLWRLRHRLSAHHRRLYALEADGDDGGRAPYIVSTPASSSAFR